MHRITLAALRAATAVRGFVLPTSPVEPGYAVWIGFDAVGGAILGIGPMPRPDGRTGEGRVPDRRWPWNAA